MSACQSDFSVSETGQILIMVIMPQFFHLQACNQLEMITISENCACPAVESSVRTKIWKEIKGTQMKI